MSRKSAREFGLFLGSLLREPIKVQKATNQARNEVIGTVIETVATLKGIEQGLVSIGLGTNEAEWNQIGKGLDEAIAADKKRIRQLAEHEHSVEVARREANRDHDEAIRQRSFLGVTARGMTDREVLDYHNKAVEKSNQDWIDAGMP